MRVVLSTYGGRGDVEPLLGLAVALRSLGSEALVCAPPDWAGRVAALNIPYVEVGPPVRPLLHGAEPVNVAQRIADVMAAQFDVLAPAAAGADVIVATGLFPATAGAQSVAEKLGIRYVYAAYCPCYLPSPLNRPQPLPGRSVPPEVTDPAELDRIDIDNYNAAFGPALNAHRTRIGLSPVTNVRDHVFTSTPWLAADPVLGPAPFPVVQPGAWSVPDSRPLPADLAAFLDAGAPPVYLGFGSMRAPADVVRVALGAIRELGHRTIVARGWSELDPIDEAFVLDEVNQQALFPRVAAVIHHGGAGTTTAAARAGAPQVVVPQMADQPYWASRVAELGIGATGESLPVALEAALSPAVRARALEVAPTIRPDGAEMAAKLLTTA
jgi:vancomycin aglycone glucosyltransferase